ncbi:DUF6051 family protein [Edaphocola aurantiacus]|uniref:DUF6051 family protein n=1 Tax=Edaphocola aurantiacus TaxID=2601682 RepID=UPI001C939C8B|nr:DUF6051 family protein [Edaphocola aurantiacus]
MIYLELHQALKKAFEQAGPVIALPKLGVSVSHHEFISEQAASMLPGSNRMGCTAHNITFEEQEQAIDRKECVLDIPDYEIESNRKFQYHIIKPLSVQTADGAIIFFHGLNEKKWDKYLPWAYEIARRTGKAVLLFPIAFHIDRAPEHWSNKKEMAAIAQYRSELAGNSACSYLNAAISVRMEALPQRLFWSGLQTYSDIVQLAEMIQEGALPEISPKATLDLFGYSIGSFLSSILMMANPKGIFDQARLFCFCGGMTIDRMFPISRYIMDAQSAIAMQRRFAELLSSGFAMDEHMAHYQDCALHKGESWFKTMLRFNYFQKEREERLEVLKDRIKCYVLRDDEVAPPVEALNTLQGGYRNIPIAVQIEHYEHPYSHINPFPLTSKNAVQIDAAFRAFTRSAAAFLGKV